MAKEYKYGGHSVHDIQYFCTMVGTVTDEVIKQYIESQKWDDDGGKGFQIVEKR